MSVNQAQQYLRSLEEKNRLRKIESEKRTSAEERRKKSLEKGFVTHFSGANEPKGRRNKKECSICGGLASAGCACASKRRSGQARSRRSMCDLSGGGDENSRSTNVSNVERATRKPRRHSISGLEVGSQQRRSRKTWGKVVDLMMLNPKDYPSSPGKDLVSEIGDEEIFASGASSPIADDVPEDLEHSEIDDHEESSCQSQSREELRVFPIEKRRRGIRSSFDDLESGFSPSASLSSLSQSAVSPATQIGIEEEKLEESSRSQGSSFKGSPSSVKRKENSHGQLNGRRERRSSRRDSQRSREGSNSMSTGSIKLELGKLKIRDQSTSIGTSRSESAMIGQDPNQDMEYQRTVETHRDSVPLNPSIPTWLQSNPVTTRRSPIYSHQTLTNTETNHTNVEGERPCLSIDIGLSNSVTDEFLSPINHDSNPHPSEALLHLPNLATRATSERDCYSSDRPSCSGESSDTSLCIPSVPTTHRHHSTNSAPAVVLPQDDSSTIEVHIGESEMERRKWRPVSVDNLPLAHEGSEIAPHQHPTDTSHNLSPLMCMPPSLPRGRMLCINFIETWGDIYYLGLNGLALLVRDEFGNLNEFYPSFHQMRASPCDINVNGHFGDPRTLDKLVDGVNCTCSEHHMWLIEFNPNEDHILEIDLGSDDFELAGLRIWNYNKNVEDTRRGARFAHVSLDGSPLSPPNGLLIKRATGTNEVDFSQMIRFGASGAILSATPSTQSLEPQDDYSLGPASPITEPIYRWCGGHGFRDLARPKKAPLDSFTKLSVDQDWETPFYPCGHTLRFDLHGTHGDLSYIGLDKIELYDGAGQLIQIDNVMNGKVLVKGKNPGESRLEPNLISGKSWVERLVTSCNRVYIAFDEPVILSMIKIWNYSKSPMRGAKEVAIFLDNLIIFSGELAPSMKNSSQRIPQTILFSPEESLLQEATVTYCGVKEQCVTFINNRSLVR